MTSSRDEINGPLPTFAHHLLSRFEVDPWTPTISGTESFEGGSRFWHWQFAAVIRRNSRGTSTVRRLLYPSSRDSAPKGAEEL